MRRALLASLLAVAAAFAASPARGDDPGPWATVNVCDTAAHPGEIGIRASMPRAGGRRTLRFRVQYRDLSDGRWRYVRGADSGWRRASRALESGWSFQVAGDGSPILRGVVLYRWSRGGRVVRRARRVTEGGHRATTGADPERFSAATCRIDS